MNNRNNYSDLLAHVKPQVIRSDAEYDRIEKVFADLMKKDRSPDEDKSFDLLAALMEDYERRTLPALEKSNPVDSLKFLMEENNLKQMDFVEIFGSQGVVSEVLNGKREISKAAAKKTRDTIFSFGKTIYLGGNMPPKMVKLQSR